MIVDDCNLPVMSYWDTPVQISEPPIADAGGPYEVNEGGTIVLSGTGTDAAGEPDSLTFAWDFNGDGQYDDATGASPTFSAAGLDGPTSHAIGLCVTDDVGASHATTAGVTVLNVAPTAEAGGPYTVGEGGTLTLNGSATDPAGSLDSLTYAWDFDGDGQFNDATGASPQFSAIGLDDPHTVTVTVRVTDDDGDSDTATAQVNVARIEAIDLGVVDFIQLSELNLTEGNVWYQLTAARSGQLTAIASAQSGLAGVALYDMSRTEPALAISTEADGRQRFDHLVSAGETYLLKLGGDAENSALTLANLVNTSDTEIEVFGTTGVDHFEFSPTGSYQITVNGVEYHFDDAQYETIVFTGGLGADTATLTGGPGDEIARLFPDHGTFGENGFLVTVNDVVAITAHGGGGSDSAFLYDSAGDDQFVTQKGYGKLWGEGFVQETFDFMYNYGYATTADGGTDVAYMEDTEVADKFKFDWPKPGQFFGKMYGGIYYNRAKNFEQIVATMTDGKNRVRLFDSEGDDTLYGQKDESRMVGDGFDVTVSGYDTLAAYASTGLDVARFEDSDGDDTTRARPHKITLWGGDDADPTYEIMARKFDEYHFEANHGGFDRAKLHDTAVSDHACAAGNSATLSTNDGELDLLYEIVAFDWVRLYGSNNGSQDTVEKEDSLDFDLVYDPAMWDELP